MEIKGKIALVLGADRGIGRAIALSLAAAGATVVCTCFDRPAGEPVLPVDNGHLVVKVDLRQPDQVAGLIHRIDQRFGLLDILINNIERGGMPVVHGGYDLEVNRDQWELEFATTVKAKWLVFNQALPLLKKAEQGAVVTLSSMAGMIGRAGPAGLLFNDGYAAANRAISSFTETWARQAAPTVRVNELMLGLTETRHAQGTRGWDLLGDSEKRELLDHTLLGRTASVDEVVAAVLFLVRDATFMTGTVLRMDGGYLLGGEPVRPMPDGVV